ncbi:fumarylacetoacetate hydrolase family protein [Brevirhabdus sp.]|uniref:fumarylacetoacetate hydrolase family protein n=1 Tax=Brevirhabdus sp. TaxID=2004514 RepID=UPI004058FF86
MQFATVDVDGRCHFGALVEDGFVDLSRFMPSWRDLRSVIEAQGLDECAKAAMLRDVTHRPGTFRHRLPVGSDIRILLGIAADGGTRICTRLASAVVGHGRSILRPASEHPLHARAGIAAIIGRRARGVDAGAALDHVAALSLYCDGAFPGMPPEVSQLWDNRDRSGALGPGCFSYADPRQLNDLTLTMHVNGARAEWMELPQAGRDLAALIARISGQLTLCPGDVVAWMPLPQGGFHAEGATGTELSAGDEIVVEATGLGQLRNRIRNERD